MWRWNVFRIEGQVFVLCLQLVGSLGKIVFTCKIQELHVFRVTWTIDTVLYHELSFASTGFLQELVNLEIYRTKTCLLQKRHLLPSDSRLVGKCVQKITKKKTRRKEHAYEFTKSKWQRLFSDNVTMLMFDSINIGKSNQLGKRGLGSLHNLSFKK